MDLTRYVIRRDDGAYYSSTGYWEPKIHKAKVYQTLGTAKARKTNLENERAYWRRPSEKVVTYVLVPLHITAGEPLTETDTGR